jgi:hypothetical protein
VPCNISASEVMGEEKRPKSSEEGEGEEVDIQ